MLELMNLANDDFSTRMFLQERQQTLPQLLQQFHLDGVELIFCQPRDEALLPADCIQGVHLRFWPSWMDLWREDRVALAYEFGDEDGIKRHYGTLTSAGWLQLWRQNIRQAAACGANYVVCHAANARPSEVCSRHFAFTDEEVIRNLAEVVNLVMADLPEDCWLLFENLWWPGLNFCRPEMADLLLSLVSHQQSGFMLDSGHLMNTNLELSDESTAVDYILQRLNGLGVLRHKIRGMHLHRSLSGSFTRQIMQSHPVNTPVHDWSEAMDYINRVDQHAPFQTDAVRRLISFVEPAYLVHEFMQTSFAAWKQQMDIQRHALGQQEGFIGGGNVR